jgi:hypothetical protein
MLELALWIGLGALVGTLLGVYHHSGTNRASPEESGPVHVGVFAVVGATAGGLQFLVLARFFYAHSVFN